VFLLLRHLLRIVYLIILVQQIGSFVPSVFDIVQMVLQYISLDVQLWLEYHKHVSTLAKTNTNEYLFILWKTLVLVLWMPNVDHLQFWMVEYYGNDNEMMMVVMTVQYHRFVYWYDVHRLVQVVSMIMVRKNFWWIDWQVYWHNLSVLFALLNDVVKNFDDDDDYENFDVELKKNQMSVNKKLYYFQEKRTDHLNEKVSILSDENEHHCCVINEIQND
jgi:hypothetical protein